MNITRATPRDGWHHRRDTPGSGADRAGYHWPSVDADADGYLMPFRPGSRHGLPGLEAGRPLPYVANGLNFFQPMLFREAIE